jgi:hypothetical protein
LFGAAKQAVSDVSKFRFFHGILAEKRLRREDVRTRQFRLAIGRRKQRRRNPVVSAG